MKPPALFIELFKHYIAYMFKNVHPGRWHNSDRRALCSSFRENRLPHIFRAFNQIPKQQTSFQSLSIFPDKTLPKLLQNSKINFGAKIEKKRPLAFSQFQPKILFFNFEVITIKSHQGRRKLNENVVCCFRI